MMIFSANDLAGLFPGWVFCWTSIVNRLFLRVSSNSTSIEIISEFHTRNLQNKKIEWNERSKTLSERRNLLNDKITTAKIRVIWKCRVHYVMYSAWQLSFRDCSELSSFLLITLHIDHFILVTFYSTHKRVCEIFANYWITSNFECLCTDRVALDLFPSNLDLFALSHPIKSQFIAVFSIFNRLISNSFSS